MNQSQDNGLVIGVGEDGEGGKGRKKVARGFRPDLMTQHCGGRVGALFASLSKRLGVSRAYSLRSGTNRALYSTSTKSLLVVQAIYLRMFLFCLRP